jgi:hypothetical protein
MLEPASSSANQKNHSWKYFDAAEILRNVSGGIQVLGVHFQAPERNTGVSFMDRYQFPSIGPVVLMT